MHWDQMRDTPEDLRKRATRLRRGVGQLGILESIIEAAEGPWLGAMDADGRGAAELRMHLAGQYRVHAVVTSAGKLSLVHVNTLAQGEGGERVLSNKTVLRRGWDEQERMPKQPDWLNYVVTWVKAVSGEVDREAVLGWLLTGAERKLATVDDIIDNLRASLAEQEQLRDERAAEVAQLRAELTSLQPNLPAVSPELTAIQPDVTAIQPDVTAVKPDVTVVRPDVTAVQPELAVVQPDPSAVQSDVTAGQSDVATPEPDIATPAPTSPGQLGVGVGAAADGAVGRQDG